MRILLDNVQMTGPYGHFFFKMQASQSAAELIINILCSARRKNLSLLSVVYLLRSGCGHATADNAVIVSSEIGGEQRGHSLTQVLLRTARQALHTSACKELSSVTHRSEVIAPRTSEPWSVVQQLSSAHATTLQLRCECESVCVF